MADSVKDLEVPEETKEKNHEPWMDHVDEAVKDIEEFRKSIPKHNQGFMRLMEKGTGQPADLWGWGTVSGGVAEVKVMYGMYRYVPGKTFHLSLAGWDVMFMSKEFFVQCVAGFMYEGSIAEEKSRKDTQAAYQADLEKRRVKAIEIELEEWRRQPLKKWWSSRKQVTVSPE